MADYIKVDTELLMRTAEEARSAGQGLREAASILSGINTGEEWWAKLGQLSTLRLADEGSSTELQNARSAVRALSTVLCRYDDRMNDLGDSIAKAASIFDGAERTNNGRISGLGAGKTVGAVAYPNGLVTLDMAYFQLDAVEEVYHWGYSDDDDLRFLESIHQYLDAHPELERGSADVVG